MFYVYSSPEKLEGKNVVLFLKKPVEGVMGRVIYAGEDELGPFLGVLRSGREDEKWERKMERFRSSEIRFIALAEDIEVLKRKRSKRRENNGETDF